MFRMACLFMSVLIGMPLAAQMGMRGRGCCTSGNQPQAASSAPVASNPVVEITGVVGQIQIAAGQGTAVP